MNINAEKTKVMVFTKQNQPPKVMLKCNNKEVEQVYSFKYLGSTVTSDARCEKEIKNRINVAKSSFINMKAILTNRKLSISTRKRLIKTHVWSSLLYGVESWTITTSMKCRLEATEMWLWRRMMKISWTELKSNEEVLRMIGEKRCLMTHIRRRQLRFFGHVMRREGLENIVTTGMIEGTKGRGRPRVRYTDGLRSAARKTNIPELIHATRNRREWRTLVDNVLEDTSLR